MYTTIELDFDSAHYDAASLADAPVAWRETGWRMGLALPGLCKPKAEALPLGAANVPALSPIIAGRNIVQRAWSGPVEPRS